MSVLLDKTFGGQTRRWDFVPEKKVVSNEEIKLSDQFQNQSVWTIHTPQFSTFADDVEPGTSFLKLSEDDKKLSPHAYMSVMDEGKKGVFSHYGDNIYFTTLDGDNPIKNGKKYTISFPDKEMCSYLTLNIKKIFLARNFPNELWNLGNEQTMFKRLSKGGVPPPIYCNFIGLTTHCNLRCSICGSQEALDYEKTKRRAIDPDVLTQVADTIFPYVSVIILASLGEPLVYPYIEILLDKAFQYGCAIKLESNGTALSSKRIKQICRIRGELFFSIDATGELFNKMRKGADWDKVNKNISTLMKLRNPELTKINIYPTVSKQTIGDMLNIVKWAVGIGVQEVTFHSYDPTMFAKEQRPTEEDFLPQVEKICQFLKQEVALSEQKEISIKVNGLEVNSAYSSREFMPPNGLPINNPIRKERYKNNEYICNVPRQHLEIGLDGQIYPCVWTGARPQDNTMGLANTPENFSQAWFGLRYRQARESLKVGSKMPKAFAQCESCIRRYSGLGSLQ